MSNIYFSSKNIDFNNPLNNYFVYSGFDVKDVLFKDEENKSQKINSNTNSSNKKSNL
jgi:hypothetical protein